jgi:hypothetical protein
MTVYANSNRFAIEKIDDNEAVNCLQIVSLLPVTDRGNIMIVDFGLYLIFSEILIRSTVTCGSGQHLISVK